MSKGCIFNVYFDFQERVEKLLWVPFFADFLEFYVFAILQTKIF